LYPRSRFVGVDLHPGPIAYAAAVANRVRFEVLDAAADLPEPFDMITKFDVIHDAVDPARILRQIHAALHRGGRYVCVDINGAERPEDNLGPVANILRLQRQLLPHRLLAEAGAGLGTRGLTEPVLRRMARTPDSAPCGTSRRRPVQHRLRTGAVTGAGPCRCLRPVLEKGPVGIVRRRSTDVGGPGQFRSGTAQRPRPTVSPPYTGWGRAARRAVARRAAEAACLRLS
jgi:SAM-dependent methyltransferase